MTETAYLAHPDFIGELEDELGDVSMRCDRLLIAPGEARAVAWAQNIWREPKRIAIESIGQGAKALRGIQRNWIHYPFEQQRRGTLLQEKLPHVSAKPIEFPKPVPKAPLGSWTLLDKHTIYCAADCSSPFPNGQPIFVEDRQTPPNRAYLKAWEAITRLETRPVPGELCLDLGSCPGGWTWVLQTLGAKVISVDKAPLEPRIAALPNIEFRQESAFGLEPKSFPQIDWLFCDIACYPQRLYDMIGRWLDSGRCENFVCTIKLQGPTDHEVVAKFMAIEGSEVVHLWHNKHELTWILTST